MLLPIHKKKKPFPRDLTEKVMGKKPGKWLRNFLTGKKDNHKEKCNNGHSVPVVLEINPATPIAIRPTTPKEKRRWSFRRSSATPKDSNSNSNSAEPNSISINQVSASSLASLDCEDEQKKHDMAMAAATAAAADAAVAAAQAAAAVIRLTSASAATNNGRAASVEEAAATKIQSVFRSYLARKALCALRGLVKLQALVRGHLVRKQATATLRCMQALVTAQGRARAQRIRMAEDGNPVSSRPPSPHRKSAHQENRYRHSNYEIDKGTEENIKIVEMDHGDLSRGAAIKGRNSYSHHPQPERPIEPRLSAHYPPSNRSYSKQDTNYLQVSPAPSAITDFSPRACSSHFEDFSFGTAQSSPQCYSAMSKPDYSEPLSYDYPLFPNYMANTQSSRAKARSQSAPKQRPPDSLERQLSRRRISLEGRNVPRAVRMQRSSSQAGSVAQNYQYPWSIKLDRSAVSLKDSECGSTSTVLTNANYCRSLVGFDIHGERY